MAREPADPFYYHEKEIRELKRQIKKQRNEIDDLEATNELLEREIKKLRGELFQINLYTFYDFKKITIGKTIEFMFRLRFIKKEEQEE